MVWLTQSDGFEIQMSARTKENLSEASPQSGTGK